MKKKFKWAIEIINKIFNRNKKVRPEINKQQISYNNFGYPIYKDRSKK